MNNDDFNQTQSVAAAFAHELASPLGAMGHALALLAEQLRACMPAERHPFFEAGLAASLAPTASCGIITDKNKRRLAQAIAKAPQMEEMTQGLEGEKLEKAIKCFELGFSLKCAQSGAESSLKILKNLRQWSDWKDFMEPAVTLAETLASAWAIVSHRCGNLKVSWELQEVPTLCANPHALTQVWANLILNAAQSNTEEVALRIATEHKDGKTIVSFENDGAQLPAGIILFQKGQTTKKSGSGLGLNLSKQIIERHGGTIEGANTESGVRFAAIFPTQG